MSIDVLNDEYINQFSIFDFLLISTVVVAFVEFCIASKKMLFVIPVGV